MSKNEKKSVFSNVRVKGRTRGLSLPPTPGPSGRPMPPVRPPKENGGKTGKG